MRILNLLFPTYIFTFIFIVFATKNANAQVVTKIIPSIEEVQDHILWYEFDNKPLISTALDSV